MTSNGVESAVRPRRFRWSLRTLLIVVAVLAAGFAILSWLPIPRPRLYRDPEIVLFMYTASQVEVYRLAPTMELQDFDEERTHHSYPIATGPMVVAGPDVEKLRGCLLDPQTWNQRDDAPTICPNYYQHRIRFKRGTDVLDVDLSVAHVTVFRNGKVISGDVWSFGSAGDDMAAAIDDIIANQASD